METLEDKRLLAGILSVVPDSAAAGTDDLLVTLTLDSSATPPPPPSHIAPASAEIGTLPGRDIARNNMEVTALFDIPADAAAGSHDVAVSFPGPFGTISYTLPGGFSVVDNGLPVITIAATDANAAEEQTGTGTFTITRSGILEGDLTVQLSLGGSATEGDDFAAVARSVVIADGQSSYDMTLTPIDDVEDESTETVTLTIAASAEYTVGSAHTATVRIADNDGTVTGGTFAVVDTGQTTFYNNASQIAAPSPGDAFYGQDAQFDGNQPSYTVSADGLTVYDNVTELTWTQSPDLDGDGDVDADDKLTFDQFLTYADTLNAQNFGGYSDWRAPTIKELYSLIDFSGEDPSGYNGTDTSQIDPFIDTDYFDFGFGDTSAGERIIDAQFWSSNEVVSGIFNGQEGAFGVNFADGRIKGYPSGNTGAFIKTEYAYFVRGNIDYGVNDFADNGDGTITDNATGLMWSQDDSGSGMNWEDALAWVEQMNDQNYLGHSDWRLPNAKELQSIVDYSRSPDTTNSAAIDPIFNVSSIIDEPGDADYPYYWSGTTHANWLGGGQSAAYVSFGEAEGYMNGVWMDVHGAGAQRSDPKDGDPADYPTGHGPQGDAIRIFNYVRLVRDADDMATENQPPTADADGAYSGNVGDSISLDGSGSTDTDGTITCYEWDLDNDGQYDDATGATASFQAATVGTFTVGLQVTDDDGATDTDTTTVTVGQVAEPFEGYTLVAPMGSTETYLIDNDGQVVHSWTSDYRPGLSVYLLENGTLMRTASLQGPSQGFNVGGASGRVERWSWDGDLLWEFEYSSVDYRLHHDIEVLPNGNILLIAWEKVDQADAIAAGRDPSLLSDGELWPDHIIEVEPTGTSGGNIVWQWHAWDHLVQDYDATKENYGVVVDHPELIDVNYVSGRESADWNHANSIDYNAELDQILLSVRSFNEIWIIDHDTTTAEAAGPAGDLLYRWGNPQAYGAGNADDQVFFGQHDAEWIGEGIAGENNILVFNNGNRVSRAYSSVDELEPPLEVDGSYTLVSGQPYDPHDLVWSYTADPSTSFFADHISGSQRLANGNTLITDGTGGILFEVSAAGETVWQYDVGGEIYRADRYAPSYPGFDGTPLDDDPIVNQPPLADAGGTYAGIVGTTITLSGARSSDVDGTIANFAWDLDGDGQFDDATGMNVDFVATTAGTFTVGLQVTDDRGATDTDAATISVSELPSGDQLVVTSLTPTSSGFVAQFNRDLDLDVLNLYDAGGAMGQMDVRIVGAVEGPVDGSLIAGTDSRTVTFVKTGDSLEPDTYTVTLRSGDDAFRDTDGNLLDGDGDGTAGDDYVATFTVAAPATRVISIPDFARGPQQDVNVPATAPGLPVTLDDGSGVDAVDFTFRYDTALLDVAGMDLSDDLQALGWSILVNTATPGQMNVTMFGIDSLPAGEVVLGYIDATVTADAEYQAAARLSLEEVQLNEGGIAAAVDDAVQLVAFVGDVTGNRSYSGLDASRIARVAVGLDTGFSAFPCRDPRILADVTGNRHLSGLDASHVARKAVGLPIDDIPDLPENQPPTETASPTRLALDTTVSLPTDVSEGNPTTLPPAPDVAINDLATTFGDPMDSYDGATHRPSTGHGDSNKPARLMVPHGQTDVAATDRAFHDSFDDPTVRILDALDPDDEELLTSLAKWQTR